MSGDFWEGPNGDAMYRGKALAIEEQPQAAVRDPYNSNPSPKKVLVAAGIRRREVIIDKGENDALEFDHQRDYLRAHIEGQIKQAEQVKEGVQTVSRQFIKEHGLFVKSIVYTRGERVVLEKVVMHTHRHQHLVDEGRARRRTLEALNDAMTADATPEEARLFILEAIKTFQFNKPITLRRST